MSVIRTCRAIMRGGNTLGAIQRTTFIPHYGRYFHSSQFQRFPQNMVTFGELRVKYAGNPDILELIDEMKYRYVPEEFFPPEQKLNHAKCLTKIVHTNPGISPELLAIVMQYSPQTEFILKVCPGPLLNIHIKILIAANKNPLLPPKLIQDMKNLLLLFKDNIYLINKILERVTTKEQAEYLIQIGRLLISSYNPSQFESYWQPIIEQIPVCPDERDELRYALRLLRENDLPCGTIMLYPHPHIVKYIRNSAFFKGLDNSADRKRAKEILQSLPKLIKGIVKQVEDVTKPQQEVCKSVEAEACQNSQQIDKPHTSKEKMPPSNDSNAKWYSRALSDYDYDDEPQNTAQQESDNPSTQMRK